MPKEIVGGTQNDFVCCDKSILPIRSSSIPMVFATMTLHEVEDNKIELVLREVHRVFAT